MRHRDGTITMLLTSVSTELTRCHTGPSALCHNLTHHARGYRHQRCDMQMCYMHNTVPLKSFGDDDRLKHTLKL